MRIEELNHLKFSMQARIVNDELAEIDLQQVIYYITKDQQVQTKITSLHNLMIAQRWDLDNPEHKAKYQSKKLELLSAFIPTGTFTRPLNAELTQYSQIVQIDFDQLTDNEMEKLEAFIKKEPSVVFSFISPSGKGRKVFHAVKPINEFDDSNLKQEYWELRQSFHITAFKHLHELYQINNVEVGFDTQIHDISRRCFFGYDPGCFINLEITPLTVDYDQSKVILKKEQDDLRGNIINSYLENVRRKGFLKQNDKEVVKLLSDLIDWLRSNKKSITNSYSEWFRVIFALKASLPNDVALNFGRQFSQLDKGFNEIEFLSQFNKVIDLSKSPTVATIFYYAREVGWELPKRVGQYVRLEHYIRDLAKYDYSIRNNIFTDCLEIRDANGWRRYNDNDQANLRVGVFNYSLTPDDINSTLITIAPEYNPVEILMSSIPEWDGIDHVNTLTFSLKPSNENMASMLIRKWMIGVIAGINEANNYNENVLILQGRQGSGKTRWVRCLIESVLNHSQLQSNRYFVEKALDSKNKDDMKLLCQSFVIFYDEMSGIVNNKSDIEAFKNLMSSKAQTLRKAYGRNENEYIRTASIVGTVNDKHFLRDTTGNRRFWVIQCGEIESLENEVLVQAWAQIKHLYLNNEKHYLDVKERELLDEYLKEFEAKSIEEELIIGYVHPFANHWMTASEILRTIESIENYKFNCSLPYFGKLLQKHFSKVSKHANRGTVYEVQISYKGQSMIEGRLPLSSRDFLNRQEIVPRNLTYGSSAQIGSVLPVEIFVPENVSGEIEL